MIWPSPIDWSQELHSALLGDHFDGLRNDLLPLSLEAQSDPTELDLGIVVVVEMVDLLKFSHFCDTEVKKQDNHQLLVFLKILLL
jgi:hypothetical protein